MGIKNFALSLFSASKPGYHFIYQEGGRPSADQQPSGETASERPVNIQGKLEAKPAAEKAKAAAQKAQEDLTKFGGVQANVIDPSRLQGVVEGAADQQKDAYNKYTTKAREIDGKYRTQLDAMKANRDSLITSKATELAKADPDYQILQKRPIDYAEGIRINKKYSGMTDFRPLEVPELMKRITEGKKDAAATLVEKDLKVEEGKLLAKANVEKENTPEYKKLQAAREQLTLSKQELQKHKDAQKALDSEVARRVAARKAANLETQNAEARQKATDATQAVGKEKGEQEAARQALEKAQSKYEGAKTTYEIAQQAYDTRATEIDQRFQQNVQALRSTRDGRIDAKSKELATNDADYQLLQKKPIDYSDGVRINKKYAGTFDFAPLDVSELMQKIEASKAKEAAKLVDKDITSLEASLARSRDASKAQAQVELKIDKRKNNVNLTKDQLEVAQRSLGKESGDVVRAESASTLAQQNASDRAAAKRRTAEEGKSDQYSAEARSGIQGQARQNLQQEIARRRQTNLTNPPQ